MLIQKAVPYEAADGRSYRLWSVSLAVSAIGSGEEVAVAMRLIPARRTTVGTVVLCTDEGCERAVSTTTSANPRADELSRILGATVRAFIEAAGI